MTAGLKKVLIVGGIAVVGLLVVGFMNGAIGAAFLGKEEGFLPAPHVELAAPVVFHIGSLGVTNTMLSAWVTTVVLILLFVGGTRRAALVPRGLQNVVEWAIESLYNFVEGVAGRQHARAFFPVIATIFLFVSFNAWLSLIPIYQSLTIENGGTETHLLRSAGTDLNMPLSIALISAVFVEFWGIRVHKLGYLKEFLRFGTLFRGLRRFSPAEVFNGAIDIFVGILELVSHFVRIVSFTFRLFGNMTAGEIVLLISAFLVSFVFTLPFYGLELLVGFIQALIFAGLTLAFALVAVSQSEEAH
ncbi:MAG: F0F1 ATP synthase subunit A [Chloroflexi bacterium]|nr:F0F1 ATP synthase subunit A [Chloroflexota bacterium]